jgi:hypothetical protein
LRQNFWIVNISYFLIWEFVNKKFMISFLLFFTLYCNIEKVVFLSFFWVSCALRVRIALIIAWCQFIEWSFQTRRRFESVSKKSKNVDSSLRRVDLYHADKTSAKSRRFVYEILIAIFFVNDRWQSEKTIRNFIEIQIH